MSKEEKIEIALNLVKIGLDNKIISNGTGLSEDMMRKFRSK